MDTTGAICTATDPRLRGGTMTVNGHKLIVPCNTLLQLPAATMTWADLFDPASSVPKGSYIGAPAVPVPANPTVNGTKTGLALADTPSPFPSFEVRAQGNVVNGKYVVGLIVPITQQGLNAGSGLISFIDYGIGAFRVGGIPNDPACVADIKAAACSGALVQVNDPVGRWGAVHSPDPRFSGDTENSTISAATGIPVCIPRVAPPANDPLCPLKNRPLNGSSFGTDAFLASGAPLRGYTMPAPAQADADPTLPDPRQQVPMMVGDQVNFKGTLYKINPAGTNTPDNMYISVHTLNDNLGIFTQPGIPPAYVNVEDLLIGTGGAAVQGILQEASTRLTVVGFTTDPTRLVEIYAQDVNPCTGQETLRLLATTDPSTQPIKGRFVHRVLGGDFMPPTRNYVMKSLTQQIDPTTGLPVVLMAANGLVTGQFLLPNFEFIFPENHAIGDPFIPFNFQDMPFLALGSGPVDGTGTPVLGQLDPWPGIPAPATVNCAATGAAPVVNAGLDITATAGSLVKLGGTVTWDPNGSASLRTLQWTQTAGVPSVTLSGATTLTPSFAAPASGGPFTFTLTASDQFGTTKDDVIVTLVSPGDTVTIAAATWATQNGKRGSFGKLNVTATTNSADPNVILTLTEIAADGTVVNWGTGSKTSTGVYDWIEAKGAKPPASLTVTSSGGGSATATCTAQDARGRVTCQ